MLVGMTSGATTVWKPLSGTSSCTGCCSGGFCCCCWSMNTIAVSTLTEVSLCPALSVAYTAAAMITVWTVSETNPTLNAFLRFFFRFDSIRTSNTANPPVPGGYVILHFPPGPLVEPALQNDDSQVRGWGRRPSAVVLPPHLSGLLAVPLLSEPQDTCLSGGHDRKVDRQAHQRPHRPPVHARRAEQRVEHVVTRRGIEPLIRAGDDRDGAGLGTTQGVDDDLDQRHAPEPTLSGFLGRARQYRTPLRHPSGEIRRQVLIDRRQADRHVRGYVNDGRSRCPARARRRRLYGAIRPALPGDENGKGRSTRGGVRSHRAQHRCSDQRHVRTEGNGPAARESPACTRVRDSMSVSNMRSPPDEAVSRTLSTEVCAVMGG